MRVRIVRQRRMALLSGQPALTVPARRWRRPKACWPVQRVAQQALRLLPERYPALALHSGLWPQERSVGMRLATLAVLRLAGPSSAEALPTSFPHQAELQATVRRW